MKYKCNNCGHKTGCSIPNILDNNKCVIKGCNGRLKIIGDTKMKLNEIVKEIKEFNDKRGYSKPEQIKDLMLNMTDEIAEFWQKIKWVDVDTQMKIIKEQHKAVENDMADMLYIVLKLSYLCNVDIEKAIAEVMNEYETRFPLTKKFNNGNKYAGGSDLKKEHTTNGGTKNE